MVAPHKCSLHGKSVTAMTTQLDLIAERSSWCQTHAQTVLDAFRGREFCADDLHGLIPEPSEPNLWGALMKKLRGSGKIKAVGVTTSQRPSRNGGLVRIYVVVE